uniref:Uncharacterized protein n=1 Tax=Zea mays TaxID=4577 RepID=B4FHS4_MAIZE|nr:unknown [Zea mays]
MIILLSVARLQLGLCLFTQFCSKQNLVYQGDLYNNVCHKFSVYHFS